MLRITQIADQDAVTLKLEGKLLEPWRLEVRRACGLLPAGAAERRLDLLEVSFVDAAGVDLLKDLIGEGFRVAACSTFVAELLQSEDQT